MKLNCIVWLAVVLLLSGSHYAQAQEVVPLLKTSATIELSSNLVSMDLEIANMQAQDFAGTLVIKSPQGLKS